MKSQDVVPVILLVAVLEKHSKLFAALVLWMVYSSNAGEKTAVA